MPRALDPMLELDRLTAAGMLAPLPHPGRPTLRAQWRHILRGGIGRICLRQLRLRRTKAADGTTSSDTAASPGLQLLRRTLADWRPAELAFIISEDSLRAVWEVADGDDGLDWIVKIPKRLERECGHFTDAELDIWCNLEGTVADIAALLDRKIAARPTVAH